jgi:alkylation response protein AidB-like acyl-CoA dehydrogenase
LQDAVVLATGTEADAQWSTALALGRRLLAEEMIGVVAAQLDLTLEHARSRTQFGRQIGSFQAVKHKLAETHVALAVARLAADDAWIDTGPIAALMAKLHAGAAVQVANRHCQQLLGGIGFTWEHPFHRYYRRGRILDALLGSSQQLTTAIGRQISERRTLPSTAQL